MISFSIIPSSISGTNAGHAASNILRLLSYFFSDALYAPLLMVTFVPIIPMLLFSLQSAAVFSAAGSIIPSIGTPGNFFLRSSRHVALTVLHAITIIFTLFFMRKSAISMEKLRIVVTALDPYGVLAVSPKYIILSSGMFFIR